MKKYKHLLFDADGTLFDYNKAEITALENTFSDFDVELNESVLLLYKEINDKLWSDFEKGLVDKNQLKIERFSQLFEKLSLKKDAKAFSQAYLEQLGQRTFLLEDAEMICQKLHTSYKMSIVTNGIDSVQKSRMKLSSIGQYFPNLFTSENLGYQKPDIAFFDQVFKSLNIANDEKHRVLIIGDSLSADIQGGMNAAIDTCWINPQKEQNFLIDKPTFEITKLTELLDFL